MVRARIAAGQGAVPGGGRRGRRADLAAGPLADARCTVSSLLRTLPTARDRLVVELRFLEGLTQSEIAARIGVSQVQVSRLLRANLARMRRAPRSAGAGGGDRNGAKCGPSAGDLPPP